MNMSAGNAFNTDKSMMTGSRLQLSSANAHIVNPLLKIPNFSHVQIESISMGVNNTSLLYTLLLNIVQFFCDEVENIVGKGEIAVNQHVHYLPIEFS